MTYCMDEMGLTLYEDDLYIGAIRKWGWDAALRQDNRYLMWVRVEEDNRYLLWVRVEEDGVRVTDVTW